MTGLDDNSYRKKFQENPMGGGGGESTPSSPLIRRGVKNYIIIIITHYNNYTLSYSSENWSLELN